MFCPQCGTKLVEGSRFCYRCGCRLADYIPELQGSQLPGTVPREVWGPQQSPSAPTDELALPEAEQPGEPAGEPPLHGPVILIDLSHKERIREDHWSALRERLREEGRVAIRTRQPVNPALLRSKKMLVIGAPEHRWVFGRGADRWQGEEIRAIERFVARGNALWVMGDGLCDAEALSEVTAPYGIRFCADPVGAVTLSRQELLRHRLTRGIDEICLGSVRGVGGNYLLVEEPAIVLAECNGRPVMAYCEHKDGRVLVLSSLSAFSQRYIGEQHNAALLDNIVDHLLHFVPPTTAPSPSETGRAESEEPAQRKPAPAADRSQDDDQSWQEPDTTVGGVTPALHTDQETAQQAYAVHPVEDYEATPRGQEKEPPARDWASPGTEYVSDYLTELDEDQAEEYDSWDSPCT